MSRKIILKTNHGSLAWGVCIVAAAVVLAGCSAYDSATERIAQHITPYRITIVQGNFVSQQSAAKMRVGMTRAEVTTTLGTPLLTDMFHANRWDYVFYFKRGSTSIVQQRSFTVHFKDDHVVSWEGGEDLPSEIELLAEIDGDRHGKIVKTGDATASAAAASGASAAVASGASAPAAAEASAPASESNVPAQDANEQAAQAANRALDQAPSSSGSTPSVSSGAPVPGAPAAVVPQFQFHGQPQPASPNQSEPVGPAGSQSSNGSASPNQPNQPAMSTEGSGQKTGG